MKKSSLLLVLGAASYAASAQQLSNTTFDGNWEDCYPWEAGSYVSSARGTQPKGWCISNVSQSALPVVGEEVSPGANGSGKAVKLSNVSASIGSNNAPGYITLGVAFATAETKMTTVRNADGGVFGGIAFSYHPDAVRFTYKHDISNGEENMSVIAYLWKGTWTQNDVPSNTAIGVFSFATATKVTMTDRIQNILGKECLTGGEVTKTDDAALIASAEYYSSVAHDDWVTREIPLNYGDYAGKAVDVEKLNIVIASNGFFDDRDLIKSGNSLIVDDVELVYYHALSALSFEGASLNFSETTTYYDMSSTVFDESKIAYTVKGQAATAIKSFNAETCVLTIRVEGEDIAVNPNSFTEYKIQFKTQPDVERLIPMVTAEKTSLMVDEDIDLILVNCEGIAAEYSVPGVISYDEGKVTALSEGTVKLILTQPQTETIEAGVFEFEFTVSKYDVAWAWNVEQKTYYPNTVIENAFQVTSGDTSLFSFGTTNASIAKVRDGKLIIGEQTGAATITICCKGNNKWNSCSQQYVVKVGAPGHVPFDLTQDLYEDMKENISSGSWDSSGGIRLGNSSEVFNWSNKDFVMEISGIPDKLTFRYQSSSGASGRQYAISESADGNNFQEIWRDNRGSGVDANSYWCRDLQLSPDTRFIKFFYYGNCAAYYRDISITELVKFAADTQEIQLDETDNTCSFTFTHANASAGKITVVAPNGITADAQEMASGFDIYGQQTISVGYNVDEGEVDDYIVISNGNQTEKVHIIARIKDPSGINNVKDDVEDDRIYNLSGQRIGKMQKGINVVNGKKVLK